MDYTAEDFRDAVIRWAPGGVDVVYDTVGGEVQARSADVLVPGGTLVSILALVDEHGLQRRGVKARYVFVAPNRDQLRELARLYDEGRLITRLAGVFPLNEAAAVQRRLEAGSITGKLVLTVSVV